MIEWYKKVVFENYANFSGRARRSEYWYFLLMNFIIAIIAMIIDNVTGIAFENIGYGPIYLVLCGSNFTSWISCNGKAFTRCREKWLVLFYSCNPDHWSFLVVISPYKRWRSRNKFLRTRSPKTILMKSMKLAQPKHN